MNIVLIVIGLVLLSFGLGLRIYSIGFARAKKINKVVPYILLVIGCFDIVLSNSFVIIPTGFTGVRSTFGQIDNDPVKNGFNFKMPFVQTIEEVNCKQTDKQFEEQIWSETSARTAIYYSKITVTYQIDSNKAAWICANISDKENLVSTSIIASAIKESSKSLSDEDATNRGKIEPLAQKNIQKAFDDKYGQGIIYINKVTISDADFDETYNQKIAEKQNAQLDYEKQQIENKKIVEKAEAEAKAKQIAAEADAKANQTLADSLSSDIFMQKMLDKWNGELPKVVGDSQSVFDISSMIDK